MAQSAHTPGPWHIRSHGSEKGAYIPIYNEEGLWIAEAMGRSGLLESRVGPDKNEEIAFNAALIAAAPDLLDALANMVHECGIAGSPSIGAMEAARAAIAKATNTELSK